MTDADKLRELLATRPHTPSIEELRSWWKISAELLRPLLDERRRFPILGGPSILWSSIAPYDAQAQINHSQDLERLGSRGGLAMPEVWCIVHGKRFREVPTDDVCERWFLAWRDQHEGLRRELERERVQHQSDNESATSAIATEAHERGVLEQVERDLRAELDVAAGERDSYRSMLCDVLASASPSERDHPAMSREWKRARELLKDGPQAVEPQRFAASDPDDAPPVGFSASLGLKVKVHDGVTPNDNVIANRAIDREGDGW